MKKIISLAIVMFLLPAAGAFAQTPALTPPPIKMGLWRNTMTSTVTGIQLPPDVAARLKAMGRPLPTGQPHTTVTESCLTPAKWHEMFEHMRKDDACHLSNTHQSSSGMSTDMACKSQDGRSISTGHMEATFDSTEKVNGKGHFEVVMQSQPRPIVMNMHFESAYQGSDCKGISPDSPKVIQ
jgi:hypothetical protein